MRAFVRSLLLAVAVLLVAAGSSSSQAVYQFKLGFKVLADQIPDVVGQPVENEHYAPNGDSLQRTTTGLLVWRKADNWTAFTNGSRTWVNGPFGLQERGNDERFPWETAASPQPSPGPQALPSFIDRFTGGTPQLPWVPFPGFFQDNLTGTIDDSSPSPEKGAGVLANNNAGGFASLAYVARAVPGDFFLESWVYVTVTQAEKGALNGLAFKVDPVGQRFYRVAAQFAANEELTLAYVGQDTQNFPVILGSWKGEDLPGGKPTASGWHKIGVQVKANRAQVFWDGTQLPGGPFLVDRVASGYAGTYATFTGGLGHAETRLDDFTVTVPAP